MMSKASPIILILLGIVFIWTGINGTLGAFLASIFSPYGVKDKEEG
jgi:hypothetical protein